MNQPDTSGKIDGKALRIITMIAFIGALGPFAIDTYLPALPNMAASLPATASQMQWTVSAFLLGMAIFPMFLSPLSDAVGRLPVLTWSLVVFGVVSAACALAPNIESFMVLRLLQAAAGGAAMTATRAIMSDMYRGNALSRATSVLMLIFTIAPVVAPIWGGWMLVIGDWTWIFWSLAVVAVISVGLTRVLPETLSPENRRAYRPRAVIAGYVEISQSRAALRYLAASFASSFMFFAMLVSSPFIFIDHFGVSATGFSWLFAGISAVAFAANYLNARLVMRRSYQVMLRDAFTAVAVLAVLMGIVAASGFGGMWSVFFVMVWLMGLYHIISANSTAGMMTAMAHRGGSAAAVLALWRFLGGAVGSTLVGAFGSTHPWTFAVVLGIAVVLMQISLRIGAPE
ncbi:MAG: multidrug effflux MFS transporter [Pikeienuella sp.]